MITLASVRPFMLSNLNLQITSSSLQQPALSLQLSLAQPITDFASNRNAMHPDTLLLQGHGVTSPRLCSNSSASSIGSGSSSSCSNKEKSQQIVTSSAQSSPSLPLMDENSRLELHRQKLHINRREGSHHHHHQHRESSNSKDTEHSDVVVVMSSCDETTKGVFGGGGCGGGDDEVNDEEEGEEEEEDDLRSLCSDDSELSVGQEEGGAATTNGGSLESHNGRCRDSDIITAAAAAAADSERSPPMAVDSADAFVSMAANALRIPAAAAAAAAAAHATSNPIVRPSPTRFQEEFLRKSQIYAEELMKHQMQLMAAARASAFSLRHPVGPVGLTASAAGVASLLPEGKIGFRPHTKSDTGGAASNLQSFNGIHSQLSAISKISQLNAAAAVACNNYGSGSGSGSGAGAGAGASDALAKLTAFGMSQHHQQSQLQQQHQQIQRDLSVPPHLNQLHQQMQAAHLPFMNNNLHESSLKFSIDNILKADFGRRITDPILKRGGGSGGTTGANYGFMNGSRAGKLSANSWHHRKSAAATIKQQHQAATAAATAKSTSTGASGTPIDLTSLMAVAAVAAASAASGNCTATTKTPAPSSSSSSSTPALNICTNSNDSTTTTSSSNTTILSSNYGGTVTKSPACSVSPLDNSGGSGGGGGGQQMINSLPADNTSMDCGTTGGGGGGGSIAGLSTASAAAGGCGNSCSSSTTSSGNGSVTGARTSNSGDGPIVWPAWVYCTRYSDRPSSGRSPRTRKPKKSANEKGASSPTSAAEDKRPRTAFSGSQLARLKHEFTENRYLTEKRRQQLSSELGLNEAQIKIWFQNKRAKLKKSSGTKNPLALQLMAQGLYNHSTVPLTREEEELQEMQANAAAAAGVV